MAFRVTALLGGWLLASACASPDTQTDESSDQLREQADVIVEAFHHAGALQGVVLLAANGEVVPKQTLMLVPPKEKPLMTGQLW